MAAFPVVSTTMTNADINDFKTFSANQKAFRNVAVVSTVIFIASAILATQMPFVLITASIVVFSIAVVSAVIMITSLIFNKTLNQKVNKCKFNLQKDILDHSLEKTDPKTLALIKNILTAGISPNIYTLHMTSPLYMAIHTNDHELIRLLKNNGARLDNTIEALIKSKWLNEGKDSPTANLLASMWPGLEYEFMMRNLS